MNSERAAAISLEYKDKTERGPLPARKKARSRAAFSSVPSSLLIKLVTRNGLRTSKLDELKNLHLVLLFGYLLKESALNIASPPEKRE